LSEKLLDEGRQVSVLALVVLQDGIGGEHVKNASQAAGEDELAGRTIWAFSLVLQLYLQIE